MTLLQILEALGVPFVVAPSKVNTEGIHPEVAFGSPPGNAELCRMKGHSKVRVLYEPKDWLKHNLVEDVLHEAMHAYFGNSTFDEEEVLMPFQWEMIKLLQGKEHLQTRENFTHYMLWGDSSDMVGASNHFVRRPVWKKLVEKTLSTGLLIRRGRRLLPVWGQGVHPSFA
jgi:hypothetical protein